MSRPIRRARATHLHAIVLREAFRYPAAHLPAMTNRHADPRSPAAKAAVRRLQMDRRNGLYCFSQPPHAHRQVQNRSDRYAMAAALQRWRSQPDQDDPPPIRHRHSQRRVWAMH